MPHVGLADLEPAEKVVAQSVVTSAEPHYLLLLADLVLCYANVCVLYVSFFLLFYRKLRDDEQKVNWLIRSL